jgi:hypothetical protein
LLRFLVWNLQLANIGVFGNPKKNKIDWPPHFFTWDPPGWSDYPTASWTPIGRGSCKKLCWMKREFQMGSGIWDITERM